MYRKLASDDQDSVRLLTIQDLIAIAQQLTPAEVKEHLIVQIRNAVGDKSWRVRYMVSNHFTEVRRMHARGDTDKGDNSDHGFCSVLQLAEAVGPELVRSELVNAYVALLKDNEAEVRTAGAGQIPGISVHVLTTRMAHNLSRDRFLQTSG